MGRNTARKGVHPGVTFPSADHLLTTTSHMDGGMETQVYLLLRRQRAEILVNRATENLKPPQSLWQSK